LETAEEGRQTVKTVLVLELLPEAEGAAEQTAQADLQVSTVADRAAQLGTRAAVAVAVAQAGLAVETVALERTGSMGLVVLAAAQEEALTVLAEALFLENFRR